ncbi:hypothetical protein K2173_016151 [Erythroxylum novogranatense]|uniref:IST1-like protein n=1 Tax=Erythroxylum novogranatense TaxID=1862640 RepID=A0AAV8SFK7_9ROSI|nr:hypothetical protein K2173_016151 [Erythroxylum novogranatense]
MLHKSFKPAKCKTSLKLAASRIKLLKNKREAQLKHLKRELAQLLEAGQEQTARIRVEHVVREEKTMAAYDLIEIYCELIVARLPMIESQKNCPVDLKEAISSVIFASPRCADIPELMDVRKHFTVKYGKEFVSAAVELRPDCGVSRLLVEKLSAKAPDGPTKIKILTTIAEEHNVKWDAKSLEEKEIKPPEDLLNGPSSFEQASKMHVESHNIQELPNRMNTAPPDFRVPPIHYEKHDVHRNFKGFSSTSSIHSEHPPSAGTGNEGMDFMHPYSGDSDFSSGKQNWNMQFKDAAAAAQAAAESAERASMAARVAAELSTRGKISRQHSTDSQNSSAIGPKDDGLPHFGGQDFQDPHMAVDPVEPVVKMRPGMHEKIDDNNEDDLAGLTERFNKLKYPNKASLSTSSNLSGASVDDYPYLDDLKRADGHSQNNSSELDSGNILGKTIPKTESIKPEKGYMSKMQDEVKPENTGDFEEAASIRRQSGNFSSLSYSKGLGYDHKKVSNFNAQTSLEESVDNPFSIDGDSSHTNTKEKSSREDATVVFDDYDSDDDVDFDVEYKYNDQGSGVYSSDGIKSSAHLLGNASVWRHEQNYDSLGKSGSQSVFASEQQSTTVFSEGLTGDTISSERDDMLPVTFDDSDDENDLDKSKLFRNAELSQNERPSSVESTFLVKDVKLNKNTLSQTPLFDSDDVKVVPEGDQVTEVGTITDQKSGYGELHHGVAKSGSNNLSDKLQKSGFSTGEGNIQQYQSPDTLYAREPINDSGLEGGKELNFGMLTGGLRNKGYKQPPYRRNPVDYPSLSKQAVEDTSAKVKQSSFTQDSSYAATDREANNQKVHPKVDKNTSSSRHFDSNGEDSDQENSQQTLSGTQQPINRTADVGKNKAFNSVTYSNLDNSDSEEDLPREAAAKTHSNVGFSRRTKKLPLDSNRTSYSKTSVPLKSSPTSVYAVERKTQSYNSYDNEFLGKPESRAKSSLYWGNHDQERSVEHSGSEPTQSERSSNENSSSRTTYAVSAQQTPSSKSNSSNFLRSSGQPRSREQTDYKPALESKKSSANEQTSNHPPKTATSDSGQVSRTTSSSDVTSNKASHVHPKLPDYDTFAAHLLSLRQNRQ